MQCLVQEVSFDSVVVLWLAFLDLMFFLLLLPKCMSSNCPLHDCSFIKDSENVHWKAQGEFWSKHKFPVFVGNCLMNLLLDPFWTHFGTFLGHLLGQKMSRGTPERA